MQAVSLFLVLALLILQVHSTLYGTTATTNLYTGKTYIQTVEVSPTGALKVIATHLVLAEAANNGVALSQSGGAFDAKNNVYYYVFEYNGVSLLRTDVANRTALPPMEILLDSISQVIVDTAGEQLLLVGYGDDDLPYLVNIPFDSPTTIVFNFTEHGVRPAASVLDPVNRIFYFTYMGVGGGVFLGQFSLENPDKTYKYESFCPKLSVSGIPWSAGMYFDAARNSIVGCLTPVGSNIAFYELYVQNNTCKTESFETTSTFCAAYDENTAVWYSTLNNATNLNAHYLSIFNTSSPNPTLYPISSFVGGLQSN